MTILLFSKAQLIRGIFILGLLLLGIDNIVMAQIQITLVISSDELAAINRTFVRYIQEYNNSNPGTTILLQVKESYDEASNFFTSNIVNGKLSGILLTRCTETVELHENGIIMPINVVTQKYPDFMAQFSQRYSCCTTPIVDSKPYGVPLYRTMPVLYYNLNTVKLAAPAFTANNTPQTWQELEELLIKIKNKTPNITPLIIGGDYYEWIFETLVMQNGGSLFKADGLPTFDSPEVVQALNYWKRLSDQKLIAPANSWKATPNFLINNKCAIIAYSSGANNILSDAGILWEASLIPGYKTRIHGLAGSNFYLSNNMNDAQLSIAVDFLKFIYYDKKISTEIANTTGLIDVTQDTRASATRSINGQDTNLYNEAKIKPNFMVKKYKKMRQILNYAIENVFNGATTPEQALKTAQTEALKQLSY